MYQDSLTSLPDWIDHLTSLFYLDVSTNHLQSLPDSIGNMTAFSYLYLYGNQLTSLPESIINLTGLAFDRGPTFSTESVIVG